MCQNHGQTPGEKFWRNNFGFDWDLCSIGTMPWAMSSPAKTVRPAPLPHSAQTKIQHELQSSWSLEWKVKYFNGSSLLETHKNKVGVISQLVKGEVGVISRLVTD